MIVGRSAVLTLAALLLTGCAGSPSERPGNIKNTPDRLATQVMLFENACPGSMPEPGAARVAPLPATLITVLAPVAADVAVRRLLAHFEGHQAQLSASYVGRGMGHLTTADGKQPPVCLVIARGHFGALRTDVKGDSTYGKLTRRHLLDTGLATWPDLYLQAKLSRSRQEETRALRGAIAENESAPADVVVIHPELLHYAATAAPRSRSATKSVGMVLLITRTTVDPTAQELGDAMLAKIPLVAESLPVGVEISEPAALRDLATAVPLPASVRGQPLNFYVLIQETEDPNQLTKLVLESLRGREDELTTALSQMLQRLTGVNAGAGGQGQDGGGAGGG